MRFGARVSKYFVMLMLMTKAPTNIKAEPGSVLAIARRCRLLRKAIAGDNKAEFGRQIGVSRTLWFAYENADTRISIETASKLRSRFGVPTDWIYFGDHRWMPAELMDSIRRIEAAETGEQGNNLH